MDKVSVFESSDFGEIRVMVINDQPWFVGSDIASALGYSNASKAVSAHVDEEDIDRILLTDLERFTQNGKSRINNSKVMIINESGVYSLILSSKLDSAKKFKKWVTSEVLPSIRKTGEYKTSSGGKGILVPDFSNPADAARAWADQYEAAQKAIAEKSQAMQTRVVDLTVELTGETKTYTVPESQNVAKAMGITLSTSIDPIMNELNAIKNTSQDIINSVDAHRAKIEACESILEDINPAFKQTREQDRKIAGIENKVNDLTDSFEDLKKLIVERLK